MMIDFLKTDDKLKAVKDLLGGVVPDKPPEQSTEDYILQSMALLSKAGPRLTPSQERGSGPPGPKPERFGDDVEWNEEDRRWELPDGTTPSNDTGIGAENEETEQPPIQFQSLYERPPAPEIDLMKSEMQVAQTRMEEGQDSWLRDYARTRWGNQNNHVVTGMEFDQVETPLMLRGVSNKEHVQGNLDGSFVGTGNHGNGSYFGMGEHLETGFLHGDMDYNGWVYATKLHPEAKIATFTDYEDAFAESVEHDLMETSEFRRDIGRMLATKGFDAIDLSEAAGFQYIVTLNQRAVIVDERSLPGGELAQRLDKEINNDYNSLQGYEEAAGNLMGFDDDDEDFDDEDYDDIVELLTRASEAMNQTPQEERQLPSGEIDGAWRDIFSETYNVRL